MKPRSKASPSLEERLAEVEAKVEFLLNAQVCDLTNTVKDLNDLRRAVTAEAPREWLTVEEASQRVGRSTVTVRSWCKHDKIGTRIGRGPWRINPAQLRRFLVDRFGEDHVPAALTDPSVD